MGRGGGAGCSARYLHLLCQLLLFSFFSFHFIIVAESLRQVSLNKQLVGATSSLDVLIDWLVGFSQSSFPDSPLDSGAARRGSVADRTALRSRAGPPVLSQPPITHHQSVSAAALLL